MKQTPMCCWHFFNKHLPKEEGGGQNHFSTKKKKKDIVSFLNSGYVCGFFFVSLCDFTTPIVKKACGI